MEEISNDSVVCSVQSSNQEMVIFDRDYWADEKGKLVSEKSLTNSSLHNIENPIAQTLSK